MQNFRVLELNRKLARLVLAEKVDLHINGANSVVHQYAEKRREVEEIEKQKRGEKAIQKQRRQNDWNSGFGRKFANRSDSFGRSQNNSRRNSFSRDDFE